VKVMVDHDLPASRSHAMFSTLSAALVPGGELLRIFLIVAILIEHFNSCRIIALMLGRLRMDVDTAINYYDDLAKQVFSVSKRWPGDGRFKATKLGEVIKSAVGNVTGDPEEPLLETGDGTICRT
jgi:hypothetical protein